jgi:hypothetical protein
LRRGRERKPQPGLTPLNRERSYTCLFSLNYFYNDSFFYILLLSMQLRYICKDFSDKPFML